MDENLPGDEKLDEAVEKMRDEASEMEARSAKLGDRIEETKSDWHAKQQDNAVPGAQPPAAGEGEQPESGSETQAPDPEND